MLKLIISGGGTGGHVFPAIAIADAVKKQAPDADILFVGAEGKLEMQKVPEAGYKIIGLDISGFQRKLSFKNIIVIWKFIRSLLKSNKIIASFKPDMVLGVGGYASAAVMKMAASKGIPILIQEQNSYAGMTNKWLAPKATKIFVAFNNMEKFFPANKIIKTGNPLRFTINQSFSKEEAFAYFNLDPNKKTIAVLGGSLGAKSINDAVVYASEDIIQNENIQLIWQTGKSYFNDLSQLSIASSKNVCMRPFIDRMDYVYGISDVVLARAGALTIAELAMMKKACILVPSPNVAEDHQRKNAQALVDVGAAKMILDKEIKEKAFKTIIELLQDEKEMSRLSNEIKQFASPSAADHIASEIIGLKR